jgi:Zn-dependent peptidase ImmA (M78 family)
VDARAFTLAHEVGHLFAEDSPYLRADDLILVISAHSLTRRAASMRPMRWRRAASVLGD